MLGAGRKHQFGGEPPTPRKPRVYAESDAQKKVVAWIRERPQWLVLRIENAARRTPAQAARDKALGMEPGAPDLLVFFHHFAFMIEMKSETGNVRQDQEQLHRQLNLRHYAVMIGRGSALTIRALERMEKYWLHHWDNPALCIGGLRGIIDQTNDQRFGA